MDRGHEINPSVSVIIPVYNTEPYLADCIRSVLAQTYENLELILVDDGSTDGSREVCEAFCRADPRVRFFSQAHRGVSAARNCALDAHRGEFAFFMDSDDLIHPRLLEQYVLYMRESSADYIYCAYMRFLLPPGEDELVCALPRPILVSVPKARMLFHQGMPRGIGGKFIRSQLIGESRFDENIRVGEDVVFINQLNLKGGRSAFYNAAWYYYRQHAKSACATVSDNIGINLESVRRIRDSAYANRDAYEGGMFYSLEWEKTLVLALQTCYLRAKKRKLQALCRDLRAQFLEATRHPLFAGVPFPYRMSFYLCFKNRVAYRVGRKGMRLWQRLLNKAVRLKRDVETPVFKVAQTDGQMNIALTFDAALGAGYTDKILGILHRHDIKATFFVSGWWVDAYPEKVAELAKMGCEVMNHSDSHPHFTHCRTEDVQDEIESCNRKIEAVTGVRPSLIRFPYGEYDNRVLECIAQVGMKAIQWSIDSLDWDERTTADDIYSRILAQIEPGAIVRCHNAGRYTPEVLERILVALKEKGYRFVAVSELTAPIQ